MSRKTIRPDEYIEKMLEIIERRDIPLKQKPTARIIEEQLNRGVEFRCHPEDKLVLQDAFNIVGKTYEAVPQFFWDGDLMNRIK